MKKIVLCCLMIIFFCGCNWDCHRTFDDPQSTYTLFMTNATNYKLKITVHYRVTDHVVDILRDDTCYISPGKTWMLWSKYEIYDYDTNELQYVLKDLYKDTMYVTNIETGDTLFAYTHADTNKYTTNFFNPTDWQFLGEEEDCEVMEGNFLFEIKE